MLAITLWLYIGVFLWGTAFSIRCPDGNVCSDSSTCCLTRHGYSCCPYPKAVCCPDMAHCCPSGFRCNLATQMCEKVNQPWMNIPMEKKETAEEPSSLDLSVTPFEQLENSNVPDAKKSSAVHCDNYYMCPDGTTCCRHPKGAWFCCPYSPGRCCLDGYHCCPYGYDCDLTYTHCVRQGLSYPFIPKQALTSVPASLISTLEDNSSVHETPMTALIDASDSPPNHGVIRCDNRYLCPNGSSCCKGSEGHWNCCPFPLGTCCADGKHCCQYGYTCDPLTSKCRR
ncbi:progranulin-like [Odontesthes bonariensis]|uniref:progranulin-like n=1 Tax=Odontesthes bonariensis TaxID=219752 RepID=UPI003F58C46B